ncbi:MAG: hypothetical protein AAF242_14315, partial [Bacteroidota bacterium]
MKWYVAVGVLALILVIAYFLIKLVAKTNVYYHIETEPSEPIPQDQATNGQVCNGGTSNLGDESLPLGFRNNNPLNLIKSGNAWKGKIKDAPGRFEQFCSMEYGTRAAMINLRSYINRYGRNTITKIVSRWAPDHENDTQAYIRFVSEQTGYKTDTPLTFQKNTVFGLLDAMSQM